MPITWHFVWSHVDPLWGPQEWVFGVLKENCKKIPLGSKGLYKDTLLSQSEGLEIYNSSVLLD